MNKLTDKFDDGVVGIIYTNKYDETDLIDISDCIDDPIILASVGNAIDRLHELENYNDYWEREAKKWCEQLAKVRVVLKSIGLTLEDILADADNMLNK